MKIVWKNISNFDVSILALVFLFFCLNFSFGQLKLLQAVLDNDSCQWLLSVVAGLYKLEDALASNISDSCALMGGAVPPH